MLLRADRHVWTGAELLAQTSGIHSLASFLARQCPFSSPPPISHTHAHTHTYIYALSNTLPSPCFSHSLCPSGKGLLLHDHSRQSSLWQAGRTVSSSASSLPLGNGPYFRCSTPQLPAPSYTSCSPSFSGIVRETACQMKVM